MHQLRFRSACTFVQSDKNVQSFKNKKKKKTYAHSQMEQCWNFIKSSTNQKTGSYIVERQWVGHLQENGQRSSSNRPKPDSLTFHKMYQTFTKVLSCAPCSSLLGTDGTHQRTGPYKVQNQSVGPRHETGQRSSGNQLKPDSTTDFHTIICQVLADYR